MPATIASIIGLATAAGSGGASLAGSKSGGKQPNTPDLFGLQNASNSYNQWSTNNQTAANRPNQVTPWGSVSWSNNPTRTETVTEKQLVGYYKGKPFYKDVQVEKPIDNWTQKTTLNPEVQSTLNNWFGAQNKISGALGSAADRVVSNYSQPFNPSGITGWGSLDTSGLPAWQYASKEGLPAWANYSNNLDPSKLPAFGNLNTDNLPDINENTLNTEGLSSFGNLNTEGLHSFGDLNTQGLSNWGNVKDLDYSKLSAMPVANDQTRQRVENALYDRASGQLDPQWNLRQAELNNQLAQQGLSPTNESYQVANSEFNRSRSNDYQNALWSAIEKGGVEQSRLFGLQMDQRQQGQSEANDIFRADLNKGQFENDTRGQQFGERKDVATFANDVRNQEWGERRNIADFANDVRDQQWGERKDTAGWLADLRNQLFGENKDIATFANDTRKQSWGEQTDYQTQADKTNTLTNALIQIMGNQNIDFANQNNQTRNMAFGENLSAAEYQDQQHANQFGEEAWKYNLPMQTLSSLMNGTKIDNPTFSNYSSANKYGNVDYADVGQSDYSNALGYLGYNNQQSANKWQGIADLISGLGGAGIQQTSKGSTGSSDIGTILRALGLGG